MDEQTIQIAKKKDWMLPASIVVAALLVSGALIYNVGKSGESVKARATTGGPAVVVHTKPAISADDPSAGSASAPVTIVMFSDPSCPFCGAAAGGNKEVMDYLRSRDKTWEPSIPGIMKDFVATGKARLVYKYFPGHGTGEQAMKMLFCANEQGKFWELHDLISKNQADVESVTKINSYAKSVGVDTAKLASCVASKKYDAKIQSDVAAGQGANIDGTPAFFVNDTYISGAISYLTMRDAINAEIK